MNKTIVQKIKVISNLYKVYTGCSTDKDLQELGLTLAEYKSFPAVVTAIQEDGIGKTIMGGLAKLLGRYGCSVELRNGIYSITI